MDEELKSKRDKILKNLCGGIVYTFHREEGFYSLTLQSDEEAVANAECNEGTLKVVNEVNGEIVFAI